MSGRALRNRTVTPQPDSKAEAELTRKRRRSQSDDDVPATRPSKATGARVSRVASSDEQGLEMRGRQRKPRATNQQVLPTLVERADLSPQHDASADKPDYPGANPTLSQQSRLSGTTARSSYSRRRSRGLDAEDMIEKLPDLNTTAENALAMVLPERLSSDNLQRVVQELKNNDSKKSKRLARMDSILESYMTLSSLAPFIDVALAVRTMHGKDSFEQIPDHRSRPDGVLHLANLAMLVSSSMRFMSGGRDEVWPIFEKLDRDFPLPFTTSARSIGILPSYRNSARQHETFDMALRIRTQVFIHAVGVRSGDPDFDPESMLSDYFFEDDDTGKFSCWNVDGLRTEQLSPQQVWIMESRVKELESVITAASDEGRESEASLLQKFPLSTFMLQLLIWTEKRAAEISQSIRKAGGAIKIRDGLDTILQTPTTLPSIHLETEPLISFAEFNQTFTSSSDLNAPTPPLPGPVPVHGYNYPGAIRWVTALGRGKQAQSKDLRAVKHKRMSAPSTMTMTKHSENSLAASSSPRAMGPSHSIGQPRQNVHPEGSSFERIQQPTSQRHERPTNDRATKQQSKAIRDKTSESRGAPGRRRFIDAQPDATKESFEDDPASQVDSTRRLKRQVGARRHAQVLQVTGDSDEPDHDSSPSEDEGFQRDPREFPSRNRDTHTVPNTARRQPGRPRKSPAADLVPAASRQTNAEKTGEPAVATPNIDSSPNPQVTQAQEYRRVNDEAKIAVSRTSEKRRQVRRPWSEEEIELFLDLMAECGGSYASVKKKDTEDVLRHRDQYALKDKARNMKFDYMKARQPLPEGLEDVPIKKSQKDQLEEMGIDVG